MVSELPAKVPSGSRGAPSRSSMPTGPTVPLRQATASVTSTARSPSRLERQPDDGRVHVHPVGDDRHADAPVDHREHGDARLAMVDTAHRVEQVRHQPGTGTDRGVELGTAWPCV